MNTKEILAVVILGLMALGALFVVIGIPLIAGFVLGNWAPAIATGVFVGCIGIVTAVAWAVRTLEVR